jgi:LEA14-like dessication related protein
MRILFVSIALFSGCAAVPILGPDLAGVRVYPKASIEMGKSSFASATGVLHIEVANRGQDAVKVGKVSVRVSDAEGEAFKSFSAQADGGGERLEPGEGLVVPVAVKWDWPQDPAAMLAVVERRLIKLRIEGSADLSGSRAEIGGPSSVSPPVLPVIAVRHVEATREGNLSGADLSFRFEVRNDNFFGIKIKSLVVSVVLEGVEMAKDQVLSNGDKVAANQSVILELPLEMNNESHPKRVRKLLGSGNLGYTITGTVRFHGLEQPVDIVGEVQFPEL